MMRPFHHYALRTTHYALFSKDDVSIILNLTYKKPPVYKAGGLAVQKLGNYALFASASSCSVQIRLPMVQLVLQADWQEV